MDKDLFRQEKGSITTEQMARVNYIKAEAQKLAEVIVDVDNKKLNADQRCINNALEKLEEAVMWAVKGYTNIKKGE